MALRTQQFSFRSLCCIAAILFAFLILLPSGNAQTGTNFVLQGNVQDSSGGVVTGATVTIRNLSIGMGRTAETDSNGHYIFSALPPAGTYELKVEMRGFGTETITGLTFQANAAPVINVTLKPGSVEQSVTVSSAAPIVETDKSEIDHTIDQQEIANLPTNGRSFFAPGASLVKSKKLRPFVGRFAI